MGFDSNSDFLLLFSVDLPIPIVIKFQKEYIKPNFHFIVGCEFLIELKFNLK
jgi:hypothetical protein